MKKIILFLFFIFVASFCFAEVDFDGTDDYIDFNEITDIEDQSLLTISVWVYHDDLDDDDTIFGNADIDFEGILLWRDDTAVLSARTDCYTIWLDDGQLGSERIEGATNSSPATTWTHVAVTINTGVGGNLRLYVNGTEDANSPVDISARWDTGNPARDVWIGDHSNGTIDELDGKITELAVWQAELSATEIELLASSRTKRMPLQIQKSNLVIYCPLDDEVEGTSGDGDTFADISGSSNQNNGTGDDGGNNTGLTCYAESYLSYPPNE